MSQSMGVRRFGACAGSIAAPSGATAVPGPPGAAPCSATAAPGGASSPPLRPQPARPNAATSAPMTAIRAKPSLDQEPNSRPPLDGRYPYQIRAKRRQHGQDEKAWCPLPLCQRLEPSVGLPAHVLWGGPAVADPAFDRV